MPEDGLIQNGRPETGYMQKCGWTVVEMKSGNGWISGPRITAT